MFPEYKSQVAWEMTVAARGEGGSLMPRSARLTAVVLAAVLISTMTMAETLRESEWAEIELARDLPDALTAPEGRTRWDLATLQLGRSWTRTLESDPVQPSWISRVEGQAVSRYRDQLGGDGAERWLLPDRDPALLKVGGSEPIRLVEELPHGSGQLWIETRRVGVGWIHLPSGPREVVLQRALLFEGTLGAAPMHPDTLIHRWIDPRAGVVAEVWGPASIDGRSRLRVEGAAILTRASTKAKGLQIYADQVDLPTYTRLAYGFDRGDGIAVSALTPDAHATIGDLVNAASWDFSGTNLGNSIAEVASTTAPINEDETCSHDQCGFTVPGGKLGREDKNFDDPENLDITTSVTQREDRAGDVTIWMRAGITKEGQTGILGTGESRLCYVGDGRKEVPLWRFSHYNAIAENWYMELADSWYNDDAFACENNVFNHTCPAGCSWPCPLYTFACTDGAETYAGRQTTTVVNEGLVTLPSGHTFNVLVLRTVAEFCVSIWSWCPGADSHVRTVIYLWQAPHLGTVVRLMSEQLAPDLETFTTLAETDIKFGLFPPRTIWTDNENITDTTVPLAWDPGLITHRIDGYKIYWDTESGGGIDGYDHSTVRPASSGTTATVTGLAPGTSYYFTITSLSDYTDPASGVTTTYESLVYPTTIETGSVPLPMEVLAPTTCTPQDEVAGLAIGKDAGGDIVMTWDPSLDICTGTYQILGADTPDLESNFSVLESQIVGTTHSFDPAASYFLVLSEGTGGAGDWGHYGR
jgi:hypothetical protein